MCWTARPVVRCVARSSGTRGSISATAASFDAPFSLSWRVIQRQNQHTRSAAQCAPSTRAAGISGTDNEQTKRKQGSARATTRDDARERRILIKENGGYSRQVGSIARRARAHLHERTSTTEEQSGSPRRLQDAQSTQRPARRTTSLPLSGAITVWYSSKFPRLYSLYVRSIHQHGFRTAKRYFGRRPRILAVLSAYFLVVYRSAKVTCTTQKKKVRLVPKMSTLEEWSGLKNTLNKSMCCIKDACFSLGSADPTPHA
jgi:hypothetical protein